MAVKIKNYGFILIILIIIILLFGPFKNHKQTELELKLEPKQDQIVNLKQTEHNPKEWVDEFKALLKKHGTDKYAHKLYTLYGLYLGPIRFNKLNILEIGLGCDMSYGPGKSLDVWREYLPNTKISVMEIDKDCADKFRNQVELMIVGSKSDFDVLKQAEAKAPYDMIVDDGGHTRLQQINSLIGLFPYVKNGGFYVLEDVYFSFTQIMNDNPKSSFDLLVQIIQHLNDPVFVYEPNPNVKFERLAGYNFEITNEIKYLIENVQSVNCFYHACVLFKKF